MATETRREAECVHLKHQVLFQELVETNQRPTMSIYTNLSTIRTFQNISSNLVPFYNLGTSRILQNKFHPIEFHILDSCIEIQKCVEFSRQSTACTYRLVQRVILVQSTGNNSSSILMFPERSVFVTVTTHVNVLAELS